MSDTSTSLPWLCDTDDALGGASTEYEYASDDTESDLDDDEAIIDPSQHYEPTFDTTQTSVMVKIIVYVVSHISYATDPPSHVMPIRIRTIPINVPPVPLRIKKKAIG